MQRFKTYRHYAKLRSAALPIFALCFFRGAALSAADDRQALSNDPLAKAASMDAGRVSPVEQRLFEESIRSTKQSIARETLDVFYRDAVDYYRKGKYDQALEWLEKIYSIDPYYEDVGTLRETIRRLKTSSDIESKRSILEDYMRKGNAAQQAGDNVQAVKFWKQALTVNASYEPAHKKIRQVNQKLAQKQYEAGYLYYHHGDMEQALDSWSNAIILDPTLKRRGLLALMSKAELSLRKEQGAKLTAQASQQYAQKDLKGALQTYEELLAIDPRNDEARRMAAKIKFQLGQSAYKAGQNALANDMYGEAIKQMQASVQYGYETQKAQKWIQEAERRVRDDRKERSAAAVKATEEKPAPEKTAAAAPPAAPPAPPVQINSEEAMKHYRQGLAAIRVKDFHRALQELEVASQLNPSDERIYVARERAKQEWAAIKAGTGAPE